MMRFEDYIKIVADEVTKLRRCDVLRLLDNAQEYGQREYALKLARWVKQNRPDLRDEIEECLIDLECGPFETPSLNA